MVLHIQNATSEKDLNYIRTLFSEYQNWLGVDICFQGFQEELQNLDEKYDCILLARFNDTVCACVGFCPSDTNKVCKIKRLSFFYFLCTNNVDKYGYHLFSRLDPRNVNAVDLFVFILQSTAL